MTIGSQLQDQMALAIERHGTTVTINAASQTTDNLYGDEINTTGTATTHTGFFINNPTKHALGKEGDFIDSDAMCVLNGSVTFNEKDIITLSGLQYEVQHYDTRRWNNQRIYSWARLNKVTEGT